MRILTILARPFYPADTGGRIRSSRIFERLSRMHDVTMACFRTRDDPDAAFEAMRACCTRLETVPWTEAQAGSAGYYGQVAASVLSPLPFTIRKYQSAAMRHRIDDLLSTGDFDLLLCDFLQPSVNCLDVTRVPKVLFQHNVEAIIRTRHAEHASGAMRAFLRQEAAKLKAFEARAGRAFDHCIMVSDHDCATMAAEYGVRTTSAIPTGVDVEYFHPPAAEAEEPDVVFVGSMDWLPNQDAVAWFVDKVLPLVRREAPARFVVVGRRPPASIRRLDDGRTVLVTGTVEDVRPFVGSAQVVVVPIRIGGGTRIKIFEAMAMERAVVSTTVGAEGLPVTHGRDILLADDAAAFAGHVVRLLGNRDERVQLGEAGRRLVQERHSWEAAAEQFSGICTRVVQDRGIRRT